MQLKTLNKKKKRRDSLKNGLIKIGSVLNVEEFYNAHIGHEKSSTEHFNSEKKSITKVSSQSIVISLETIYKNFAIRSVMN